MLRGSKSGVRRALAALLALLVAAVYADETHWRDLESRIQYGYYTEDVRALHALADSLASEESQEALRGYYAAFAAFRLALLAARSPPLERATPAAELAQRCVRALDGLIEAQPGFADALALRAACQQPPVAGGGLHLPFLGHSALKDRERARALAPRNPRVLLVDAAADYELPAQQGGNRERALVRLREAVSAFEAERAGTAPLPGWGAAEAYLLLARDLLDHGDALGARDALERALLIAPDYAEARRLMTRVGAG